MILQIILDLPAYGFPVAPNQFHVKDVCIFGAAKHNDKWQGVRLYL